MLKNKWLDESNFVFWGNFRVTSIAQFGFIFIATNAKIKINYVVYYVVYFIYIIIQETDYLYVINCFCFILYYFICHKTLNIGIKKDLKQARMRMLLQSYPRLSTRISEQGTNEYSAFISH